MTQRILHNKDFFANVVLFLMAMSLFADMALPGVRHTSEISSSDRTLCHLVQISILGAMSVFVCCNYAMPRIPAVMFWEVSLFAFLSLSVCHAVFISSREQLVTFTKFAYWPIGYLFFRLLADDVRGYTKKLSYLLVALSVFAAWGHASQADVRSEIAATVTGAAGAVSSNLGWDLLYIFEVSLCLVAAGDRKGHVVGAVALLLVPVSLKRGAIIAESAAAVSLLLAGYRLGLLRKFVRKNAHWIVGAVLVWSFVCVSQLRFIVTRFSTMAEDGGSGRSQIYPLLFGHWRDADLFHWLFGFGFWSTPEYLDRVWLDRIYAHSDILEVLHDYGAVGVLSYLMVVLGFLGLCRYAWRLQDAGIIVAASACSLFVVTGVISGTVMFRETIYLMMPLGYIVGRLEKDDAAWRLTEHELLPVRPAIRSYGGIHASVHDAPMRLDTGRGGLLSPDS